MIYGDVIDAAYAKVMGEDSSPKNLAKMATKVQTSADREKAATKMVNTMKTEYGDGISSLILIYNATGYPLNFYQNANYSGRMSKYQPDDLIQNGQWGCFLHVKSSGTMTGSCGVVSYKMDETNLFWFFWSTPYSGENTAEVQGYPVKVWNEKSWGYIEDRAEGRDSARGEYKNHWTLGKWMTSQTTSPIVRFTATRSDI